MAKPDLSQALSTSIWTTTAGLITSMPSHAIPNQACAAVSNMYGYQGKLRRRPGFTVAFGGSAIAAGVTVCSLAQHSTLAGVKTTVALTYTNASGVLRFWEWDGVSVWTERTGAAVLVSSLFAPVTPQMVNFKGVLYITTGNQGVYQWTGTGTNISLLTNGDPTVIPYETPKGIMSWDGHLWTINSGDGAAGAAPARIAWSDFLDATVWRDGLNSGAAGFEDLYYGEDSSDQLYGIIDMRDNFLVFKPRSSYYGAATGDSRFYEIRPLQPGFGLASQNSLRRLQDSALWLGWDNFYRSDGIKPKAIGDAIIPYLQTVTNAPRMTQANAIVDPIRQLYHVFLPTSTNQFLLKMFTYNIREESWWEGTIANTSIQPFSSLVLYNNPMDVTLYVGCSDGKIYKLDYDATTDGGTKFTASWTSKVFDAAKLFHYEMMPAEFETMDIQKIAAHAESGKCRIQLRFGPSLDDMVSGVTLTQTFSGKKTEKFVCPKEGSRFVQILVTVPDVADFPEIQGFTWHLMPRGQVR